MLVVQQVAAQTCSSACREAPFRRCCRMMHRRLFAIRTAGALGALATSSAAAFADQLYATAAVSKGLDREIKELGDAAAPERLAGDEKFWARVRGAYELNPDVLNLDHGWTNPATR